ncbi:MAG: SH3 domain-containing protein [Proteobacteria bacterium]|nr:SH3 domain-containing protein [Pseudomonadota bacterium]
MDERQNLRKRQYSTIIGIIALILIPVTTSFQYGLIDLLYAEQVGSVKAELSSSTGRQKLISAKITCLQIIQEDYEGLKISYPSEVFVEPVKKEIYVVDSGNSRILIYASDFYPLFSIDSTYGVESPAGLAIDSEGYLFIAQAKSKGNKKERISILNASLGWEKDIYFEGFEGADSFGPSNIAISKRGYLYVTGSSYRGVVVLDKDGAFSHLLTPVDSLGTSPEEKATICDVDIDNQGNIYLLSEDMGRIYVYDSQDRYLFKFGQKGGSSGKLSRPRGIAVDSAGERIYVIDYMRHTASAYSNDGQFLFEFGGKGWGKGWFQYPTDIVVDSLGNVLVADTFNDRVQVLNIKETPSVEKVKEPKPEVTIAQKVPEAKIPEYYLLTSNMNLREESNTDSRIRLLMKEGEEFQILDEHKQDDLNTWHFIKSKSDLKGWICGIYRGENMFKEKLEAKAKPAEVETVEEVKAPKPSVSVAKEVSEPEKYYILISDMNLREKSNTDSRIILLMKEGEEFQILDERKRGELYHWYYIETRSGLKGWFCGIYKGETRFKKTVNREP